MTDDLNDFTREDFERLQYYVYLYVDPFSDTPFYVGKGKGKRADHHLTDKGEHPLVARLNDIRSRGSLPRVEILAYGLDEDTAFKVEAAAIDLIGFQNLTNRQIGHGAAQYGRQSIDALRTRFAREPLTVVQHDCIALKIDKSLDEARERLGSRFDGVSDESRMALYDCVRGAWAVNIDRVASRKYVLAVYSGVVREVYQAAQWLPAGSSLYFDGSKTFGEGRYEFVGSLAPEPIRDLYRLKRLRLAGQQPIRYLDAGTEIRGVLE